MLKLKNEGFDHVEYIVESIARRGNVYERMGYEKVGERHLTKRGIRSSLYQQGRIRILLTESDGTPAAEKENCVQFLRHQSEGVCVLAVEVENATEAFKSAVARGAKPAMEPQMYESPEGRVFRAEVWTPGRVRYAFIERHSPHGSSAPALFDEGLRVTRLDSPMPLGMFRIDHLTNNVGIGEMKNWVEWYKTVFGFKVTRHFSISTGRTGLISDVVESPCRRVKVPINEATEPASQVQEFVNRMKGPGVQHLALQVNDLPGTLTTLRARAFKFLQVPHTYYEAVPTRIKGVTEDLKELERLGILLDGEGGGYLLQIFSEEILGPFFFEFIQRKGNEGFGEGNFRALFEAIERDQIKRGVLSAR